MLETEPTPEISPTHKKRTAALEIQSRMYEVYLFWYGGSDPRRENCRNYQSEQEIAPLPEPQPGDIVMFVEDDPVTGAYEVGYRVFTEEDKTNSNLTAVLHMPHE
jgi:hypothetical protein